MILFGILWLTMWAAGAHSESGDKSLHSKKQLELIVPTGDVSWDQREGDGQSAPHVSKQQVAVPAAKPVLDPPWALGIHFAPEVAVDSLRPVDVVLPADPGLDLADHAVSPMLELVDAAPVALNLRHAL